MAVISPASPATIASQSDAKALVEALRDPACYPHPARDIEVVETHISYVVLAGDFAYKIRKPIRLAFADFTTLAARRFFCEEEVRLNSRTAPQLYRGVVPIVGRLPSVQVGGNGQAIEFAVRMVRFESRDLLSNRAREHVVQPEHVDSLADCVAQLHARASAADAHSPFGAPESIVNAMLACFAEIAQADSSREVRDLMEPLQEWARTQSEQLYTRFAVRKAAGFVRECHGDLHLGNVVLIGNAPVLFDELEFNEWMRWGDVCSDVAFLMMDLLHHEQPRHAWRLLNRYLERTGDYGALPLLRYYMVYRALVRAKVAAIRAAQERTAMRAGVRRYLSTARSLAHRGTSLLVVMQGLSGSGKTTVSQRLAEALQAVRVRSDVERGRMALAYGKDDSAQVYWHLAQVAREALGAGWPAVVDAAFLDRAQRNRFRDMARELGAAFEIVRCDCPAEVLRTRVEERLREKRDASQADAAVLEWQIAHGDTLAPEERLHSVCVDTTHPGEWQGAIENLARRFRVTAP
jgi:aminoglycoside phosphotransferase family enzyme/predicted kinase